MSDPILKALEELEDRLLGGGGEKTDWTTPSGKPIEMPRMLCGWRIIIDDTLPVGFGEVGPFEVKIRSEDWPALKAYCEANQRKIDEEAAARLEGG